MKRACAILLLLVLVVVASSCKKTPEPNPTPVPTPTDTITPGDTIPPIVPTREVVIPWCWSSGDGWAPWMDTIKYYVQQPDVKHVVIYMVPGPQSTWRPSYFHTAKDSLQTRFDVDTTKVIGDGWIKVGRDGAHIHPDTLTKKYGMWEPDSLWFAMHGFKIKRFEENSK